MTLNLFLIPNPHLPGENIAAHLRQSGYTVHSTPPPHRPDLVLFPVEGWAQEAWQKRLRQLKREWSPAPCILLSRDTSPDFRRQCFANGGADYLPLPLVEEEFRAKLAAHRPEKAARFPLFQEILAGPACALSKPPTFTLKPRQPSACLMIHALDQIEEATYLVKEGEQGFFYASKEACRALGYSRAELLNTPLPQVDAGWTPEWWAQLWSPDNPEKNFVYDRQLRTRTGQLFPVEVTACRFRYQGSEFFLALVRDISERKNREQQIRLLTHAIDQSSDSVFLINEQEGRFIYVNQTACHLLGYSREEMEQLKPQDIDASLPAQKIEAIHRAMFACETVYPVVESLHRAKDGRMIPVEITSSVFAYEGSRFILSTVRNLTDKKESESRLKSKEMSFRSLVENLPGSLVRYDREFRRTYANPMTFLHINESLEGFVGKRLTEDSLSLDIPHYLNALQSVFSTGQSITFDHRYRAKNGIRWARSTFAPEFDPQGEIASVLAIGIDIHELRESEKRFRSLTRHLPDNIAKYDTQGHCIYINPAFVRTLGLNSLSDILGRHFSTVPSLNNAQYQVLLQEVLLTGQSREGEITLHQEANQPPRIHLVHIVAEHDESGRIIGALSIGRDVTPLKRSEHRLQESLRLLQALATRRESAREEERKKIAREIHDELGQQLTALRMGLSTLRLEFAPQAPLLAERVGSLVALIDQSIEEVRNIAAMLRPAVLDKGVGAAFEWLTREFQKASGIHLHLELPRDYGKLADEIAVPLFRIAQESLTNITRHAQATEARLQLDIQPQCCRLSISDNGKGFNPEEKQGSFGLQGITERCQMLNGQLAIHSRPQGGTQITVTIPLCHGGPS